MIYHVEYARIDTVMKAQSMRTQEHESYVEWSINPVLQWIITWEYIVE